MTKTEELELRGRVASLEGQLLGLQRYLTAIVKQAGGELRVSPESKRGVTERDQLIIGVTPDGGLLCRVGAAHNTQPSEAKT